MVVFGHAGFGKSRLLEELAARAALDGGSVAVCRAVEAERDEPWMGLGALLRGGLIEFPGVAGGPPAAHASLGRLAGEWRERFAGESGGQDMPCSQAFAEILRVAADERPVLLVSDDAQWLDRETLLAFDALLRDLGSCPIMLAVAATAHPARVELESLATRVGREVPGSVVTLEPLDPAELTDLARWWLPRFTSEELERVVRRVAADSAGIPLLASELFRAVALGLDLHRLAAWPEPSRTLDHTLPADLPVSVVAAIRVAFRRLGAPAQAILAAAAALPEPVSAERLCRATGSSLEDVTPALDELEWHRWLVADSRGYSFVARIVRDTVARDMLTEGQRRRIRTL
jgi:predicted ATPase